MIETILVEGMSTCFSFCAPIIICRTEEKRAAEEIFELLGLLRLLIDILSVLVEQFAGDLRVTIDNPNPGQEVHDYSREFPSVKPSCLLIINVVHKISEEI